MLSTFKVSFKLRIAYKTNGVIYGLKSLPLIKKLLPDSLYGSHNLKIFATIISISAELSSIFIGKLLYFASLYWAMILLKMTPESLVHIITFLTFIGAILNTNMFNPTKDKYYAICLMRMDSGKYVISNYIYYLIKTFVGFLVFSVIFGLISGIGIIACIAVSVLVISVKPCYSAWVLMKYKRTKKANNENKPSVIMWITVIILLVVAFLPPYLGYAISEGFFLLLTTLMVIPAVSSIIYIFKFGAYRKIYKELLTPENLYINTSKKTTTEAQLLAMQKKITMDPSQISKKTGYKYFNDLFVKRHSKLLTKSAKWITLISILIYLIVVGLCLFFPDKTKKFNEVLHSSLPYFLFIMYSINRGSIITQAMFMNCDHSMLTYRFYRQPKAILSLFVERLKSIIIINLMPALVIAVGLPSLMLITGGTDQPINYLLLFVSILSMSVFFSVHHIVLYYLLQPYNINLESRSFTYAIANFLTYILCYYTMGKQIPTIIFGSTITVFCIIYVIVAFILAYKLAPKTFRLK